jgi:hypothetical protein
MITGLKGPQIEDKKDFLTPLKSGIEDMSMKKVTSSTSDCLSMRFRLLK